MNQTKKEKLKVLLGKLNALDGSSNMPVLEMETMAEDLIEEEIAGMTAKIRGNPTIKILQKFTAELARMKKGFDLKPIIESIKGLQEEIQTSENTLLEEFETRIKAIKIAPDLTKQVNQLQIEFDTKIEKLKDNSLRADLDNIKSQLETIVENSITQNTEDKKDAEMNLEKLKGEIFSRISNLGGGSMNRQILIGGVDPFTRYTDYNIKAGSNITITYANNNTTKKVDVTFTASGGGGGAGIVRSINNISISTAAGNSTTTDYVYLCTGTLTVTLPDAAANTNLYTIKNVGTGVVTVATTSSQTIDGSLTITLPVQYTSVDIESDTANWNVT